MNTNNNYGFATKQIHAGKQPDVNGSLCAPIYQTSTFYFDCVEQGGARFAGQEEGYIYSRLGNPTLTVLEDKLAVLENAEAGLVTASGMGAISTTLWTALKAGDNVVASDTLYGCTYALLNHGLPRYGVEVDFIDMSNLETLAAAIKPNTTVVYFETPCNPTLKIVDIAGVAETVHKINPDIKVIVDNTFSSPYITNPLDFGADVVVHSATKYLNGHGDLIAGAIVGKSDFITQCRMFGIKDMTGAVMSPMNAFLMARGMKTLHIRMERHCENATKLANYLEAHSMVKKVYYPGLESFEGHELAKKQMRAFGGMIAFELEASREETASVLNHLELATIAVSLGDAETLVEHPASMTHSTYTAEELAASGIPEGLVRVSVGLENVEDIIADFEQAFKTIK